VVATVAAAVVLLGGLLMWMKFVAPENIWGAFLVAQLTLLLLLIPRFWQRAVAVSYWQQKMMAPVSVTHPQIMPQPIMPPPQPVSPAATPPVVPVVPNAPPEPQGF
jgi:hypothetical protein